MNSVLLMEQLISGARLLPSDTANFRDFGVAEVLPALPNASSSNVARDFTPVVFIDGLLSSFKGIEDQAAFGRWNVWVPDLLGYNNLSEAPPSDVSVRKQVEHVCHEIRARFKGRSVHLVGHSTGAIVAYLLAHRHPELVASIVDVEGGFTLHRTSWQKSLIRTTRAQAKVMLSSLISDPRAWLIWAGVPAGWTDISLSSKWLSRQPASSIWAMVASLAEETGRNGFERMLGSVFVSRPVHLVAGERSRCSGNPPDWVVQGAASFTTLPKLGHLMMLEDPAKFARVITNLLSR
jgi:pimeloyl-ACP methyl ester carboxylesterase